MAFGDRMIDGNIDTNAVFKKGFDTALIDPGISSLTRKRLDRLIPKSNCEIDVTINDLRNPIDGLLSEIESHLMGVLKLFTETPGSIKKRIKAFRVHPEEEQVFESLQWLQPALGVVLLMPGDRKDAFMISKHNGLEGSLREEIELTSIDTDATKIKVVAFNAASMIFSWNIPKNSTNEDQILLSILFEEISDV